MKFHIMGVMEYTDKDKKMLKIIGRKNTLTTSCEVIHPGSVIGIKQVIETVSLLLNIKQDSIIIPLHIKDRLKERG